MKLLFCILTLFLGGCASYSPSLHNSPEGKDVVYVLSIEQAKLIVSSVMTSHFAGRSVEPLASPAIGFTTYTRMLLDTWTTTVTITPVTARQNKEEFQALRIEVSGGGTSFVTGQIIFEGFKDRLRSELDKTASMKLIDGYVIK